MRKIEINRKMYESLGLSENESLVFNALLDYPMSNSIPKLVQTTGLPRSTVRDVLKRLEDRKIAEQVLWGKRWRWRFKPGIEKLGQYGIKYKPVARQIKQAKSDS